MRLIAAVLPRWPTWVEGADGEHNWAGGDGASRQRGVHRSLRILMRPHRSGFQLDATVCVQVGEAIVYQIGRPQAGSRRLIRSAASAARETANAASRNQPVLASPLIVSNPICCCRVA